MKTGLHTFTGAQRVAGGGAQVTPCPSHSQACPRSHQPVTDPSPQAQRSMGKNGRREPKLRTQKKDHPVQAPPRVVPQEPQPSCPGMKAIKTSQHQSTFWMEGGCHGGLWDALRDAGQRYFGTA